MPTIDLAEILAGNSDLEPPWVVQDIIAQGSFVILAGEEGVGKSYLSYTLAIATAAGLSFLGHPTTQTRVLYFDDENARHDHAKYLQWAWRGLGCPPVADLVQSLRIEHFTLSNANWRKEMPPIVEAYQPGLVIVDTVTPALNIGDENDNAEANQAIRSLRQIQALTRGRAAFLLLKHAKFTGDDHARRTIRGAKTWVGATDATYFHVMNRGRTRVDGLRGTQLIPEKYRAFGLRGIIRISPEWVECQGKGLKLNGNLAQPGLAQE